MWVRGTSEKGSSVAVRSERIAAVRDKGKSCWICVDGQWIGLVAEFNDLVERLERGEK